MRAVYPFVTFTRFGGGGLLPYEPKQSAGNYLPAELHCNSEADTDINSTNTPTVETLVFSLANFWHSQVLVASVWYICAYLQVSYST
jgi:hypothetical protein